MNRLRILVSGMIAGDPNQGGAAWAVLQYVLGLRGMGHDVLLVEPIKAKSIRPAGAPLTESVNARYFDSVAARFGLGTSAALVREETREVVGPEYGALVQAARDRDLLINISGMLTDAALMERIARRVYLDLDPAFNQLWHAVERIDVHLDGHTHFVTVGCAIGADGCDVPTCDREWLPTLQPVVLAEWPATPGRRDRAWTTVANWRGYGSIRHRDALYGQKVHSFRRFFELPQRTRETFRPALSIHPDEQKDLNALAVNGWDVVDAGAVADTPDRYRRFIQSSKGELAIAKSGYVESRCGWFSDRSACYLASGRPVVAQDTAFGQYLPTGEGLIAFGTLEEAAGAIERVSAGYEKHCRRAREIAEAHFRADLVLGRLLERLGAADETRPQRTFPAVAAPVGTSAPARGAAG